MSQYYRVMSVGARVYLFFLALARARARARACDGKVNPRVKLSCLVSAERGGKGDFTSAKREGEGVKGEGGGGQRATEVLFFALRASFLTRKFLLPLF